MSEYTLRRLYYLADCRKVLELSDEKMIMLKLKYGDRITNKEISNEIDDKAAGLAEESEECPSEYTWRLEI